MYPCKDYLISPLGIKARRSIRAVRQQNDDSCATLKGPFEGSLRPNRRIPDVSEG